MALQLGLLPSGNLQCFLLDVAEDLALGAFATIRKAFAQHIGAGLFALAARPSHADLHPTLVFWREFACLYLNARCRLPEMSPGQTESVAMLNRANSTALLLSVPPMRGAEYLSADVLEHTWQLLDRWFGEQIQAYAGLANYLEVNAPHWHQVGRVCFHLAENTNDTQYPFAFIATYAPGMTGQGRVRHQPLHRALQEYAGAKNKKALIRLLAPVHIAAEASPQVKALVNSGDLYHPLAWTAAEAYAFLKDTALYEHSGVLVRLPNWWRKRNRPRIGLTIGERKQNHLGVDALLDFRLKMMLGDTDLSQSEFEKILAAGDGLRFIKGQWVEVDQKKLTEALVHWQKVATTAEREGLSFAAGMRLLAGASADLNHKQNNQEDRQWSFVQPGKWLAALLDEINAPGTKLTRDPGVALKASLRAYQKTGVNWLWLLSQLGLGACLADDMGLGKTMQVVALLLLLKKKRCNTPALLVLPASLLANWQVELDRYAPSLRCLFIHSSQTPKKSRRKSLPGPVSMELNHVDVVLTTYGTLLRQAWLQERNWQLLVLDEAQAIKNPATRQTKAVKKIKANARIALTGTPVENRLTDLWSLFDFLNPGLLGSIGRFKDFVKALSERDTDQYAPLRKLLQPYILRRLKTDKSIISDLPEKTEMLVYCGLSKVQATYYQQAVQELAQSLSNLVGIQRRGLVLAALLRFKQICNHPAHFLGNAEYAPQQSGKFIRLGEICEEIASRQEKMLVFTQFREMTAPLATFLALQFGQQGLVLHGGTPVRQRQKLVARFQHQAGPPFFILSLKAGGTGLNLTEASHVIHFDRWWNPAVENQATDRAFRIGQKKNVLVHKFVCRGTVEERIDALIKDKTSLANDLLTAGGETLLTELDNKALLSLVSLDIDKAHIH